MDAKQLAVTLSRHWGISLIEPSLTTFSATLFFTEWQGHPAVLKIPQPGSDELLAAPILQCYAGHGAVTLFYASQEAMLLERAVPGTSLLPLTLSGQDEDATLIICNTIEKLHSCSGSPHIAAPLSRLAKGFNRYLAFSQGDIPVSLVEEAQTTFTNLLASQTNPRLLHGDLHHENMLYDSKRGWLAIDPKGYWGDPVYEVGCMLRNPIDHPAVFTSPAVINRRVEIICQRLGYSRERVLQWAFAQAVLSAIWCIEDMQEPHTSLEAAWAFRSLLNR